MGAVKALELEQMFQTEERDTLNAENSYNLTKGVVTILEYEIIRAKIKFDYDVVMNKIDADAKKY